MVFVWCKWWCFPQSWANITLLFSDGFITWWIYIYFSRFITHVVCPNTACMFLSKLGQTCNKFGFENFCLRWVHWTRLQRVKRCKRNCSLQVLILTKHLNIAVNYLDAKKSARCGQVLVVTKLIVKGTQRTTFLQGNTVSVTVYLLHKKYSLLRLLWEITAFVKRY